MRKCRSQTPGPPHIVGKKMTESDNALKENIGEGVSGFSTTDNNNNCLLPHEFETLSESDEEGNNNNAAVSLVGNDEGHNSSDWETDNEMPHDQDEMLQPTPTKHLDDIPRTRAPSPISADYNNSSGGYVSLKRKLLGNYVNHVDEDKKKNAIRKKVLRWDDGYIIMRDEKNRLDEGADLVGGIHHPSSLLLLEDDSDLLGGMKGIGQILDNNQLTMKQKYKSLGIDEDDDDYEDYDDTTHCSCWHWVRYKLGRMYKSQWPILLSTWTPQPQPYYDLSYKGE